MAHSNTAASSPLDAFVAAAATKVDLSTSEALHHALAGHPQVAANGIDQVRACLSAAASALRESLGDTTRVRIATGDEAFAELQRLQRPSSGGSGEAARAELIEALYLATERLGPLPGGRLGQPPKPDGSPHTVTLVEPTPDEQHGMAAGAGAAVGELAAAHATDAVAVLERILAERNV